MPADKIFVGCGSGFSGDRTDAAVHVLNTLIESAKPSFLVYETLAERTLALAHIEKVRDPSKGYEPQLESFLRSVLKACVAHRIPIIGNFGAANPKAAAEVVLGLARELRIPRIKIGLIEGDSLLETIPSEKLKKWDTTPPIREGAGGHVLAANVYLGAKEIVDALAQGADVVVTGRVADAALFLAPIAFYFNYKWDDWNKLAIGACVGHLLECGAQVTGGYFADPGFKDVSDLSNVGFPIAEVTATGELLITKARGTGGNVSERSVKEQLLYEVHDPYAYLTPDVTLDFSDVSVKEISHNRVQVSGLKGKRRPEELKALICTDGGYIGEAEISYAGPNAANRAHLAVEVLRNRIRLFHGALKHRLDMIGVGSVFNDDGGKWLAAVSPAPVSDVRVRLAVQTDNRVSAQNALREVVALYTSGPAAGGGVRQNIVPRIQTHSTLIPRELIKTRVILKEGTL
jgi:hypothetical protein